MLYLTCTMISSVDLAHYGVSHAKAWVSVDCGTILFVDIEDSLMFVDVGGVEAAEGATYAAPAKIPYKFSMVGNVRGYHKVLSVTSEQDKLKVEPLEDKSTTVNSFII